MAAKLYSLNAFKVARSKEGLGARDAARFARHVATEMQQDGDMEPGPVVEREKLANECLAALQETEAAREGYTRENPHPDVHDIGAPYGYGVGSKYEKGLDVVEIAKRLRQDIKARVAKGEWPKGLKVSVTIDRFSGGRSIDMNVTACPKPMLNPERVLREAANPNEFIDHRECRRMTDFGEALLKDLEAMGNAYRYDRSDSQTDYFDTNFYLHVRYDWQAEKAEKDAILAAQKAAK